MVLLVFEHYFQNYFGKIRAVNFIDGENQI